MDEWLDSLSEDWISQPRSSKSNSVLNTSPVPGNSSHESNPSQSRIPRYHPRSVSDAARSVATQSQRRSLSTTDPKKKAALSERSLSNINVSQSQGRKGPVNTGSPAAEAVPKTRRQASTASLPSMRQDTVQHRPSRPSPLKSSSPQATPEWKRRVLQGNIAAGDKCDLFSPIGLEKVFRPPTLAPRTKPRQGAKAKAPLDEFPSSPPPFPSSVKKASNTGSGNLEPFQPPVLPLMETRAGGNGQKEAVSGKGGSLRKKSQGKRHHRGKSETSTSSTPTEPPHSTHNIPQHLPNKLRRPKARSSPPGAMLSSEPLSPRTEPDTANVYELSAPVEESRNISTQNEDRDEKISPFYISRHQTVDGRIDYAAVDMSMHQLRTQIDQLQLQQQHRHISPSSDNRCDYTDSRSTDDHPLPSNENNDWTTHSLPEDLSTGTDAFAANGGFVNIRRGGYSDDGSFQRRPLSPSSLPAFDSSRLRSSPPSSRNVTNHRLSKAPSITTTKPSPLPSTPKEKVAQNPSSQEQARSSGSPLKLFDKYDTFTNDRLSRRMSKFEEAMRNDIDEENSADIEGADDSIVPKNSTSRQRQPPQTQRNNMNHQSNARISSFGEGELDGHVFKTYNSSVSHPVAEQDKYVEGLRSMAEPNPGAFKFEQWPNSNSQPHNPTKGTLPGGSPQNSSHGFKRGREDYDGEPNLPMNITPASNGKNKILKEDSRNAQGKRLPRSPAKNPQSKRRRTIRSSEEVDQGSPRAETAAETKAPIVQSVVGRKRKDALYDGQSQAADPKILAMRQMLRPRSSTNGSQGRSVLEGRAIGNEDKNLQTLATLESGPVQHLNMDPPTKQLAEELATFTLDMVQDITHGSRKASVTTADFFNEAQQIMQLIRAQGRPQSNHEIAEEPQAETQAEQESYVEESTKDEFSRPPSRVGASLRRLREPAQVDPRIISHLRKFEDKDDLGITLSSSLKSLQIGQSNEESLQINRNLQGRGNNIESEPPNLRILSQNIQLDKGKRLSSVEDVPALSIDTKVQSVGSHSTSGPSTGRSLHTVSSRGSGNKVVIAPETVSHLLSDQIAGMTFDHDRQVWVKCKVVSKTNDLGMSHCASSEMTDEDLLGEIPDLSVDELEEMQRIKDAANSLKRTGSESDGISNHDYAKPFKMRDGEFCPSDEYQDDRPRTAEGALLPANEDSSEPSKYSRFASSGVAETRATSWGDDVLPQKGGETAFETSPKPSIDYDEHDEDVEHEISILEGRQSRTPTRSNHKDRQARVVTVAFSSPLIDQMTPYASNGGLGTWEDESDLDLDDSPVRFDSRPEVSPLRKPSSHAGRRPSYRSASRRRSLGSQSYVARPMSRLDEQDEITFLQSNGASNAKLDMVISTPLSFQHSMIAPHVPSTGQRSSVGFHLSPLADFTVHQTDSPNPGRRNLTDRCGLLPLHEVQGRFSLATQDLVKQLTDLEPFEPYWDFIRSIDLQKRGLVTLHTLGDFCPRIEELDVSDNALDQLDGAPSSVRDLKICRNQLSDLTAWGHLQNLQYLDVSHNQLRSLKGFQGLVHLRELKADGNLIESLDGILEHDGLIRLSLRGNLVKSIDFEGSNL